MDRNEKRTYCKTRLYQFREILEQTNEQPFSVNMENWIFNWDGKVLKVLKDEIILGYADETLIELSDLVNDFYHFPLEFLELMIDNRVLPCYN